MRKTFFFLALGLLVAISANAVEKKVYSYYNSSTKTLTFTYDDQYDSRSNVEYYTGSSDRRFSGYETEVTSIVVDQSLETLHRASWARLFYAGGSGTTEYHLSKVTSITGLQYIKTDLATDLTGMFNGLESIESIDVSTFNTSKVISTSWVFGSCKKLKTINLGDMDITALTNTTFMFGYCNALEKIYCTTDFSASTTSSTSTTWQSSSAPRISARTPMAKPTTTSVHSWLATRKLRTSKQKLRRLATPSKPVRA